MVMPTWQEIIDDILEVLTLKHPALKDSSSINYLTISSSNSNDRSRFKDEQIDDFLDALVIHKYKCGHSVKVPKHMYEAVSEEFSTRCDRCSI